MITARLGQRIVSRRPKCKAECGTVIRVAPYDEWEGYYWVLVHWDYGASNYVRSDERRLHDLKMKRTVKRGL